MFNPGGRRSAEIGIGIPNDYDGESREWKTVGGEEKAEIWKKYKK